MAIYNPGPRITREPACPQAGQSNCGHACDLHCLFDTAGKLFHLHGIAGPLVNVEHQRCETGAHLYRRGEPRESIVSIRSGRVKLVDFSSGGTPRIVLLAGGGDAIGMESLLGSPMNYDAVVLQPTEICRVRVALLQQLADQDPELYRQLMTFWQRNLAFANECIVRFSMGPTPVRVARLIEYLYRTETGKNARDHQVTLLNRPDMAALVGAAAENVSRAIATFRRARILTKLKRNLYVCNCAAMKAIADAE